jgi:hypothetical protein
MGHTVDFVKMTLRLLKNDRNFGLTDRGRTTASDNGQTFASQLRWIAERGYFLVELPRNRSFAMVFGENLLLGNTFEILPYCPKDLDTPFVRHNLFVNFCCEAYQETLWTGFKEMTRA